MIHWIRDKSRHLTGFCFAARHLSMLAILLLTMAFTAGPSMAQCEDTDLDGRYGMRAALERQVCVDPRLVVNLDWIPGDV
jgi:hypothetical protein